MSACLLLGTRYFLYDGTEPVCEFNASGTILAVNMFGANGLLSRWTSTAGYQYYLFDSKGNVANYVNASGTATNIGYDAYGKVEGIGVSDPFGYGGQWGYTTETGGRDTGFILCTHRYYDPNTGRWLTRDPIGYEGGVNLYGYVGGDPVNSVDPEGKARRKRSRETSNESVSIWKRIKHGILTAWTYIFPDAIGLPISVISHPNAPDICRDSPRATCNEMFKRCYSAFLESNSISRKCRKSMAACRKQFPHDKAFDIGSSYWQED